MKATFVTILRTLAAAIGSLAVFQNVRAQDALVAYSATAFKDGVLISFTMKGGYSCNGINIERSEDSISFSVIGDIQGICGNPDFDVPFSFIDEQPLANKKNFYRLDLKQLGYSPVMAVYFAKLNTNGTLLFPNPCISRCILYVDNPKREKIIVELYQGKRKIDSKITDQGVVEWNVESLAAGLYFYQVQWPDNNLLKGNLVIIKP